MLQDGPYRETFETDNGYRFHNGDRSILIQTIAVGRPLSNRQKAAFVKASSDFLASIAGRPPVSRLNPRPLSSGDFPAVEDDLFYRFATLDAAKHMRQGSFRLGTPRYYRSIGDSGRADGLEGHAGLFLEGERKTFSCMAVVGFNCATISGVSRLPRDKRTLRDMKQKFGTTLVRIKSLAKFGAAIGAQLGAVAHAAMDIKYCDGKYMAIATNDLDDLVDRFGTGDLTEEKVHQINVRYWDALYQHIKLASIFSKPVSYSFERERRIMFELPGDSLEPFITVHLPDVLEHVEFIDDLS